MPGSQKAILRNKGDAMLSNRERHEKYKEQRLADKKKYYAKTAYKYPQRPWTEEEEALVMQHAIADSELSDHLGRSVKSIQEKRRKIRRCAEAGKPLHQQPKQVQQFSEEFYEAARLWKEGKIPALEGARRCGMPNSTFRFRANKLYAAAEKAEHSEE